MKFFKRIARGIGSVANLVNKVLPVVGPVLGMAGPQGRALLAGATTAGKVGQAIGNL